MSHHIQQYKHNFKKTVTQTAEDTEKLEPSYIVGGNIKCCSCFGKQFGSSSRSETIELLIGPTNSTLGTYPRHKNLYMNVHIIIIYDNQKVETNVYQLMSGISKIWYNHTMEFSSSIKRNEVLRCATA